MEHLLETHGELRDNILKLAALLRRSQRILILPHEYADGDALGSSGALAVFLRALGKQVTVLTNEPVEHRLAFLPELSGVEFEEAPAVIKSDMADNFDTAIAVDISAPDRLSRRQKLFEGVANRVRIDHHAAGSEFAPLSVVEPEWAAAAEGVYLLLRELGFDREGVDAGRQESGVGTECGVDRADHVDAADRVDPADPAETLSPEESRAVAACIYTALVTDTGGFAFSNVTARTHYIASRMRTLTGDMSFVYRRVFETKPLSTVRLLKAVYNKLYFPDEGIAALVLTQADFDEAGANDEDAGGISNILRSIEGVHAGIFVKPDKVPGRYRVSMRSDESCNVAAVASAFGGGGHVCAAGCEFTARDPEALAKAMDRLIGAVKEEMANNDHN